MKIGLITTLDTNIGDDFIREGIVKLLNAFFSGKQIEYVPVNKHQPYGVYPDSHSIHIRKMAGRDPLGQGRLQRIADAVFSRLGQSRFDSCDLIVQCGAPVFWPECNRNEWAKPLWHQIVGRLFDRIPVLNLAAGACYPWQRQHEVSHSSEDGEYIQSILGYCRLTTVRDRLARSICESFGRDVSLIPCSAFLAGRGRRAGLDASGYVLINYMRGGGHYEWGQGIDPDRWEKAVRGLIARLGGRHRTAFLCHDDKEYTLAEELDPSLPRFYPKSPEEYFNCVAGAKFGICNRMHASVGMAGLGIPSVAVCTDTRLLMVEELGLPVHYVGEADADLLIEETERLLGVLPVERDRLLTLQEETWGRYLDVIKGAIA